MLSDLYKQIRQETLSRCDKLSPEDMLPQPEVFVSPPKWHLAHTTWFFETFVLKAFDLKYKEFDPDFNFLFNSYYEAVGERVKRDKRGLLFRPPLSQVLAYRTYVDEKVLALIGNGINEQIKNLIVLGLQHEQQHQELLVTDTKYTFFQHPLYPVWDDSKSLSHLQMDKKIDWLLVNEGVYEIGFDGGGFCFDNELGLHKQYIQSFSIMNRPVTNAEYVAFIEDGGYANSRLWLSEGWEWLRATQADSPLYWVKKEGAYFFYHQDGLKPLHGQLPLMHINYYEADAFARWMEMRLPTEFEWETAAKRYTEHFDTPVWEWTGSAYLPYPGFKVAAGAVGEYNGKFMVNQMVLRGKSIATPQGHSRVSYRNFFPADAQWQFSGIRLVKNS